MLGTQHSCVQELPGNDPVGLPSVLGRTYPLTRGAAGKALLLALDESRIQEILSDPDVAAPPRGVEALLADLQQGRQRGYTESNGENIEGASSVAAPVLWLNEGVAAIRVTGPAERFGEVRMKAAGTAVLEETDRIRSALSSR
jgi:DNA-binding IclR family transcriptional regulator